MASASKESSPYQWLSSFLLVRHPRPAYFLKSVTAQTTKALISNSSSKLFPNSGVLIWFARLTSITAPSRAHAGSQNPRELPEVLRCRILLCLRLQNFQDLCTDHSIENETVAVRLFVKTFDGLALS